MTPVTIAGAERHIQPIDASRVVIVGQLLGNAIGGMAKTQEALIAFENKHTVTLTQEHLDDAGWQQDLDALGVPAEERVVGLKLARNVTDAQKLAHVLPVAVKEVPDALFNLAAAMFIPNKVLHQAYAGKRLPALVEEEAGRLRFGTEENDWKGASSQEILTVIITAYPQIRAEVDAAVPLGQAALSMLEDSTTEEPSESSTPGSPLAAV